MINMNFSVTTESKKLRLSSVSMDNSRSFLPRFGFGFHPAGLAGQNPKLARIAATGLE